MLGLILKHNQAAYYFVYYLDTVVANYDYKIPVVGFIVVEVATKMEKTGQSSDLDQSYLKMD